MTPTANRTLTTPVNGESLNGVTADRSSADCALITQIVAEIVAAVKPLKIILFGSMTTQSAAQASDMDLLVVVVTPKLLDAHRNNIGLIYHTILKEGLEIYAA